jgi:hypothetical protein
MVLIVYDFAFMMINIFVMKKSNQQAQVRDIAHDVYTKFKRVRDIHSELYGSYQLYTKNSLKYVGKLLPNNFQLITTRNPLYQIFRYASAEGHIYLFPLHGQPLSSLFGKWQQ